MNHLWLLIYHSIDGKPKLFTTQLIHQGCALSIPFVLGSIINTFQQKQQEEFSIYILLIAMLLVMAMSSIFQRLGETIKIRCFANVEQQMKMKLWHMVEHLDAPGFNRTPPPEWLQIITRDIPLAVDSFQLVFSYFLRIAIFFTGSCIMIGLNAPIVLLLYFFLIPTTIFCHRLFYRKIELTSKKLRRSCYQQCSVILDTLQMVPILKVFHLFYPCKKIFSDITHAYKAHSLKSSELIIHYNFIIQSVICVFHVGIMSFNIFLYQTGIISLGDIVAYYFLGALLVAEISQFMLILPRVGIGCESMKALSSLMLASTKANEIPKYSTFPAAEKYQNSVSFRHVTFSYLNQSSPIIDNFSADFNKGACVVLSGGNGTGKSTFLELILGLQQPDQGTISLSRDRIGWLPQNVIISKNSWLENIRLNDASISEQKIIDIIKHYRLYPLLRRFGNNLNSYIHRDTLSGGELQCLGIARALVRTPDIVVLDEPTNNMDLITRKMVHRLIKKLKKTCTVFVVSHDVESLTYADRILFFSKEKITDISDLSIEQRIEYVVDFSN